MLSVGTTTAAGVVEVDFDDSDDAEVEVLAMTVALGEGEKVKNDVEDEPEEKVVPRSVSVAEELTGTVDPEGVIVGVGEETTTVPLVGTETPVPEGFTVTDGMVMIESVALAVVVTSVAFGVGTIPPVTSDRTLLTAELRGSGVDVTTPVGSSRIAGELEEDVADTVEFDSATECV